MLRFIDTHLATGRLPHGLAPLGPDLALAQLRSALPAEVLEAWVALPRWRFIDRPSREMEGILVLLPPAHRDDLIGWHVDRDSRQLFRILWPTESSARRELLTLLRAQGEAEADSGLFEALVPMIGSILDEDSLPVSCYFDQFALRHVQGLALLSGAASGSLSSAQLAWAQTRERDLALLAWAILCDLLEPAWRAACEDPHVCPAWVYNWIRQSGGAAPARRLAAWVSNPDAILGAMCQGRSFLDRAHPIRFLDLRLADPDESVASALEKFGPWLDGWLTESESTELWRQGELLPDGGGVDCAAS